MSKDSSAGEMNWRARTHLPCGWCLLRRRGEGQSAGV
jgi:hypothetical protein